MTQPNAQISLLATWDVHIQSTTRRVMRAQEVATAFPVVSLMYSNSLTMQIHRDIRSTKHTLAQTKLWLQQRSILLMEMAIQS